MYTVCVLSYVTGSGKRAHLTQVIIFFFIALSERAHFVAIPGYKKSQFMNNIIIN